MRSIEHPFDTSTSPEAAVTVTTARLDVPLTDTELDPAIFEPLPITDVEAFARPPLRLVGPAADELGRRGAAASWAPARPALPVRPVRPALRLTRRGRAVVVAGGVLLAVLVSSLVFVSAAGSGAGRAAGPAPVAGAETVTVQPGDTLWAIASRAAPSADPRVTVQKIIDRNGLAGVSIEAGEVLALPSSSS